MTLSHEIELENVSFHYPTEKINALDHVSVTFDIGKCYFIVGPNGCGKSTLFRILLGLDFPSEGHYYLEKKEVTQKSMRDSSFSQFLHRKIGFLFQNSEVQLFTSSVENEIAFGLQQLGLSDREVKARVDHYISLFHLEDVRYKAPFNISGGEKKRTALAAVCAMEPDILVMDEPLSGLDEDGQKWMMQFINESDRTHRMFIIATHNRELCSAADQIIYMNHLHQIISDCSIH